MNSTHMVIPRHQQPARKAYQQEYMKRYGTNLTEEQREAHRVQNRAHYHNNKEYYRSWRKENVVSRMCTTAKQRAKKKGVEYTLDKSLIHLPSHCPILGMRLEMHQGEGAGGKDNSFSLDRKDPTKGYVDDNVWIISNKANCMKSSATQEELLKFASWIITEYTQ